MKLIIKHGEKIELDEKLYTIDCPVCKCRFYCTDTECGHGKRLDGYCFTKCPECGEMVEFKRSDVECKYLSQIKNFNPGINGEKIEYSLSLTSFVSEELLSDPKYESMVVEDMFRAFKYKFENMSLDEFKCGCIFSSVKLNKSEGK